MLNPDSRSFLRPLELSLSLAGSAVRLLDGVRAGVVAVVGVGLAGVGRLGDGAWRLLSSCWAVPTEGAREHSVTGARVAWREPVAPGRGSDRADPAEAASPEIESLVAALRDPSVEVALVAIEALGASRDPAATDALRAVLANGDGYFHPTARVAAVTALAGALRKTDLAPVFEAVRDLDADVSVAALAAIGKHAPELAPSHAVPVLRDRSGYHPPLVRLAAARALEQSGHLSTALAYDLLESEPDAAVRAVLERAAS